MLSQNLLLCRKLLQIKTLVKLLLKSQLITIKITNTKLQSRRNKETLINSTFDAISIYYPEFHKNKNKRSMYNSVQNFKPKFANRVNSMNKTNGYNSKLSPIKKGKPEVTYECMINMWSLSSKSGAIYWPKSDKHIICSSWIPYYSSLGPANQYNYLLSKGS